MNELNLLTNTAMNENGDEKTMSSREIADITGKNHGDVMRDIRTVAKQLEVDGISSGEYSIKLSTYKAGNGEQRNMYNLNYKAVLLVLSGYGVAIREKVLESVSMMHLYELLEGLDVQDLPADRFVYVAMESESHRFKVGISKDPVRRIKELNIGNPENLVLVHAYLATERGNLSETLAHAVLSDNAVRSEWFDKDTDLNKLPSYNAAA